MASGSIILVSLPKAHLAILGQTHIRSHLRTDWKCPIFNVQLYAGQFYQGPALLKRMMVIMTKLKVMMIIMTKLPAIYHDTSPSWLLSYYSHMHTSLHLYAL